MLLWREFFARKKKYHPCLLKHSETAEHGKPLKISGFLFCARISSCGAMFLQFLIFVLHEFGSTLEGVKFPKHGTNFKQ